MNHKKTKTKRPTGVTRTVGDINEGPYHNRPTLFLQLLVQFTNGEGALNLIPVVFAPWKRLFFGHTYINILGILKYNICTLFQYLNTLVKR